ncbi:MAG: hypothetical protein ACTSQY_00635 [Candidatus Odinarchaeia archaeon]
MKSRINKIRDNIAELLNIQSAQLAIAISNENEFEVKYLNGDSLTSEQIDSIKSEYPNFKYKLGLIKFNGIND